MRQKLQQWLGTPLPPQYRAGLEADILRTQFWPTIVVGLLIILMELLLILVTILRPGSVHGQAERRTYLFMYILLFAAVCVVTAFVLLWREKLRKKPAVFHRLRVLCCAVICVWGSFISAYGHRVSADLTVFTYIVLACSVFMMAPPWQAALVFGGNQLMFYLFLAAFAAPGVPVYGSIINSIIATLLGVFVASLMYRNRAMHYYNTETIRQQNEKILLINNQLRNLVLTDELTGAFNRRYLDEVVPEMMEDAIRAEEPLAMFMLDIDRFKQYNDIYGHQQGDVCLAQVADIIRTTMMTHECVFVRYGGEEFAVFLHGQDQSHSVELAESVRRNVARCRIEHSGSPWGYVTVCLGVDTALPNEDTNVHEMLRHADEALYIAKNNGRNKVHLYGGADTVSEDWEQ